MKERYSYLERVVTVEHGRRLEYFGHIIADVRTVSEPYEWMPNTTIYENDVEIVILVELAGLRSDHVIVVVDGDRLILRGRRLLPMRGPVSAYHHIEIPTGSFQKAIRFREQITSDRVSTAMKDGLFEIRVSKT